MKSKLAFVLVNWHGYENTKCCLRSLIKYTKASAIVVDNSEGMNEFQRFQNCLLNDLTQDEIDNPSEITFQFIDAIAGEFDPINQIAREIIVVKSSENNGFGTGCNLGAKFAEMSGYKWIWLLNNDAYFIEHLSDRLITELDVNDVYGSVLLNPATGCIESYVGGRLNTFTGATKLNTDPDEISSVDYINGASFLISVDNFKKLSGFDESIFMYSEDIDLSLRAVAAGSRIRLVDFVVHHKSGGSFTHANQYKRWAHVYANNFYVLKKHYGLGIWQFFYVIKLILLTILFFFNSGKSKAALMALKNIFRSRLPT